MSDTDTFPVHCKACGHEWSVLMPLPMPIERAVTVMKGAVAAGCPKCGAHGANVLCGRVTPTVHVPLPEQQPDQR